MTAALARSFLPAARLGKGSAVWLTRNAAYKFYWGPGAPDRIRAELEGYDRARQCPAWGSHVLPLRPSRRLPLLCARRGRSLPLNGPQDPELFAFVDQRIRVAAWRDLPVRAQDAVDTRRLHLGLGSEAFERLVEPFRKALADAWLPLGPAHGDLHRGNIVALDDRYFVLDCDRFNPGSSPLFDRIHFDLMERKLVRRLRWIDLLAESEDVIRAAMKVEGNVAGSVGQLAIAYGFNRIAHESYGALLKHRPREKYCELALRLLQAYSGTAPPKVGISRARAPAARHVAEALLSAEASAERWPAAQRPWAPQ